MAFLFDEPLSNLDAQLRSQMRIEIKRLHQRLSTTIVYVTHDQIEAITMADKIVVIRDGRILEVGTPTEPFGSETLVHLDIAGTEVIATAPGKVVPKVNTTVTAPAMAGSLYLFSAADEHRFDRL